VKSLYPKEHIQLQTELNSRGLAELMDQGIALSAKPQAGVKKSFLRDFLVKTVAVRRMQLLLK